MKTWILASAITLGLAGAAMAQTNQSGPVPPGNSAAQGATVPASPQGSATIDNQSTGSIPYSGTQATQPAPKSGAPQGTPGNGDPSNTTGGRN